MNRIVNNIHRRWLLLIAALNAALCWRGLISNQWMLSKQGMDGYEYIYHAFAFVRESLARGELPVWNPYVFCGTPVLEAFQYCAQYPVRWLFAPLPVTLTVNWMLYAHLCLAGAAMYGWVWYRVRSGLGAFAAGAVFMWCGPLLARVTSGHFVLAYGMAWIPLVFWGIDGWQRERRARWITLAAGGAAMQLYAGAPQYFYFTALLAGLYSLWSLTMRDGKIKTAAGLLAIYPLAAAVLVPGWLTAREALRAGGVPAEWAATASLQFKDLLLTVAPNFYGGIGDWSFWDNEHLHEMWVYSGLGGLLLAGVGLAKISAREKVRLGFLLTVTLVLALGAYTPLFGLMREYVPLYAGFRSHGRWTVYFSLFVALLAGVGVGKIVSGEKIPRSLTWSFIGLGAMMLLTGLLLHSDSLNDWYRDLADWLTFKPLFRQNLPLTGQRLLAQIQSAEALTWSGLVALTLGLTAQFGNYGLTGLRAYGLTGLRAYGLTGLRAYGLTGLRAY
ncbi:MAG: YfhO family protein [Verrucomicrobiales bacterium]|jgi:hypothetical protein|nr:YfhO family protein [Verrucomicrobiales bacterium]